MQNLKVCDFSLIGNLLAGGIFYDLIYTSLASSASHLNKFEQHSAQNATNIIMRISIWIQLSTYKVSCDVTNAMTSSFFDVISTYINLLKKI